jgi:hypothetical protein
MPQVDASKHLSESVLRKGFMDGSENESLFFHAPQTRTSKGDDEFVVAHRLGLSGSTKSPRSSVSSTDDSPCDTDNDSDDSKDSNS